MSHLRNAPYPHEGQFIWPTSLALMGTEGEKNTVLSLNFDLRSRTRHGSCEEGKQCSLFNATSLGELICCRQQTQNRVNHSTKPQHNYDLQLPLCELCTFQLSADTHLRDPLPSMSCRGVFVGDRKRNGEEVA